jgi:hypothetical protein
VPSKLLPPDHYFSSREHLHGLYRLLRNYLYYPIIFLREAPPAACLPSKPSFQRHTTPLTCEPAVYIYMGHVQKMKSPTTCHYGRGRGRWRWRWAVRRRPGRAPPVAPGPSFSHLSPSSYLLCRCPLSAAARGTRSWGLGVSCDPEPDLRWADMRCVVRRCAPTIPTRAFCWLVASCVLLRSTGPQITSALAPFSLNL